MKAMAAVTLGFLCIAAEGAQPQEFERQVMAPQVKGTAIDSGRTTATNPAAAQNGDSLLVVRRAVGLLFKILSGQHLNGDEIEELERQFTKEGFASLINVWSEEGFEPGMSGGTDRERFIVLMRSIVDEIKADGGKPDPWTVEPEHNGIRNGRSVGFHLGLPPDSYGRYLAQQLLSDAQARPEDLLVMTNDPFGDDEAYLFVLAQENGNLRIKLCVLIG